MPSFDIVSEIDTHELTNAIDQANRDIGKRFDFKGTDSRVERDDKALLVFAPTEFQINQIMEILYGNLTRRSIDIKCLETSDTVQVGKETRRSITARAGIDKDNARSLVKKIKETKFKVQAAIQGEQVRVTGKKRDDLQAVMAMLKKTDCDLPLQYTNFRN